MSRTRLASLLEELEDAETKAEKGKVGISKSDLPIVNEDGEKVTLENLSESDIDNILDAIPTEQVRKIVYGLLRPKGAELPDEDFDPEQLAIGIEIEKEHFDSPYMQKGITKGHLSEKYGKKYYTELKKMEDNLKNSSSEK
jgi:hypothetical protein